MRLFSLPSLPPIHWLLLFCIGGVCVSCEEIIDSPFEIVESKLVLASTFAPNAAVTVRVTATQPVTGELVFSEVTNATVTLFEGPDLIEELRYLPGQNDQPGRYVTENFHPEVGHRYTVHALADGFTPVTAESQIPVHVDILSLEVTDLSVLPMIGRDVYDYRLKVDYADPVDELNYYDLRISQQIIPYRVSPLGDTVRYDPIYKSVLPAGAGFNIEPTVGGQASVLLRDKPTDAGVSIQLQSVVQPSQELIGNIFAELRTVSEPYFLFQANLQDEGTVAGGVLEPRVNSYTNVSSGYGVFAGYNVSTYVYSIGL